MSDLCTFSQAKEIINSIKVEDIVQMESSIGTRTSLSNNPYQVIELRIVFQNQEKGECQESEKSL